MENTVYSSLLNLMTIPGRNCVAEIMELLTVCGLDPTGVETFSIAQCSALNRPAGVPSPPPGSRFVEGWRLPIADDSPPRYPARPRGEPGHPGDGTARPRCVRQSPGRSAR